MELEHLTPSREHDAPIDLQLYRRYREAIASGKLNPGDRVPSVRSLASELNLARGTGEVAYQMLVSEGYFTTRGTSGTVVSPHLDGLPEPGHAASFTPAQPPTSSLSHSTSEVLPFQLGLPALDAFPRKAWVRLTGRRLRSLDTAAIRCGGPSQPIWEYRGVSPARKPGDLGWYEEPGYLLARQFLQQAGMRLEPVPVDEEGLNVASAQQRAADARFAVVTPTHQSPTGVALSLPRRLELLDWASRRSAWIIEDDYDSEFRYHGRPLPALKSLDRDGWVLYTGTFSKVLFPGLRLAYLVVPAGQVATFKAAAHQYPSAGSILSQAMVADFMEQGHFTRHLRKMRALYAQRHQFLIDALNRTMGQRLYVSPQAGGIHVLAYLNGRTDPRCLRAATRRTQLCAGAAAHDRCQKTGAGAGDEGAGAARGSGVGAVEERGRFSDQ